MWKFRPPPSIRKKGDGALVASLVLLLLLNCVLQPDGPIVL